MCLQCNMVAFAYGVSGFCCSPSRPPPESWIVAPNLCFGCSFDYNFHKLSRYAHSSSWPCSAYHCMYVEPLCMECVKCVQKGKCGQWSQNLCRTGVPNAKREAHL